MPDPIKKYKTPNNKIVGGDVLKEKYGDKFTELVSSGKLTEVNEPTYKTPNGLIVEESVLKNKYGEDQFKSLVSDNKFVLDYTPKKKDESKPTSENPKLVSEVQDTDGSLGTSEPQKTENKSPNYATLPEEKANDDTSVIEGPVFEDIGDPKSELQNKYAVENRSNFTDQEWKEAQQLGYAPPDSKVIANSRFNVSLEDMTLPPDEQRKKFEELSQPIKEALDKDYDTKKQDFGDGALTTSFMPTEEEIKETKRSASRIKEAKDLNIEHPFRYYSDLKVGETNSFIESTYGSEQLKDLGVDVADFEGFLKEKGYKDDYMSRKERGLFNKDTDSYTGANQALSDEMERFKLLSFYISEKDKRANLKQKYDAIEQLGYESVDESIPITKFDQKKLKAFIETEFPVMSQELKHRDEKNKELYEKHVNGEAGVLYGTGQFFKKGWHGIEDRINNLSATVYDKVGMDNVADNIRYTLDQTKLARPNTREVVYVSGNEAEYDDRTYIVDAKNRIIDKDLKLDVTDLFLDPRPIINKSKSGNSTSVFSPQGAAMQTGNVVGDLLVQITAQGALSRVGLGPTASAVVAQSALGYSSGFEDAYRDARSIGVLDAEAKDIANDIAGEMAIWYGLTSIISPQTKATQAIFGSEKKTLVNSAINAYKEGGKKGLNTYLANTTKKFANKASTYVEEGGKEAIQENIQQTGELKIGERFNEEVGRDVRQTEFSKDDFINTTILSFVAGGLPAMVNINGNKTSSIDRLEALKALTDNSDGNIDKIIAPLIENGTLQPSEATELLSDLTAYKNQRSKIPQDLNPEVALKVMHDLESVRQIEEKKKTLDPSFHTELDEELKGLRAQISEVVTFSKLDKEVISNYKEKALDEIQSTKNEDENYTITDKEITEKAIELYAKENATQETQEETQSEVEVATPKTDTSTTLSDQEVITPIEDTPSPTVELSIENTNEKSNETQAPGNTATDGNLQPRVEPSVQQRQDNNTQPTVEPGPSETKTEVKVGRGTFEVTLDEAGIPTKAVSKKTGKEISKTTERVIKKKGEDKGKIKVEANRQWVKIKNKALGVKSDNQIKQERKARLNNALNNFNPETLFDKAVEFFARGGVLSNRSAQKETGYSQNELKWVSRDSRIRPEAELETVEKVAENLDRENAMEMRDALIDAMQMFKNREAAEDYVIEKYNTKSESNNDNQSQNYEDQVEESYLNSLSPEEKALYESNKADVIFDSEMTEEDQITYYQEQYEKQIESLSTEEQAKLYEQSERRLATQSNSDGQSTKKPTKEERKEIAKAKVDDIADAIKGIDSIFGIKIKIDDVDGINKNGVDIVNLIASIAKQAIDAGIDIDEAIQKTINHLKTNFSFEVDINQVKAKLQPKKKSPNNDFKRKSGKKSLVNRVYTGKASPELKKALEKSGLDYEVESQDEAKSRAEAFVKAIGLDGAIDALKSGAIKPGAELAFIYSTVIDMMESQSDKATGKEKDRLEQEYAKLQEDIFVQFDNQAREFGRFLSALRKVYNSSYFKYNISKQIEAHKARNGGEIDAETLAKFKERDAKLKEFEKKIKELESKLEQAEAQQAIENIQEYNERQKPKRKPSKSSLKRAAEALRKTKFTQSINDLSKLQSDPTGVIKGIWDGAIEIMATALDAGATMETAIKKGINHIKKSDWYKGLKQKNKKIVESKFKQDVESIVENESIEDDFEVFIDEDGKISIPAKLIRQLVASGITEINQLAENIMDEYLADEDVTLREVRDAITGYGKTINPTKDELSEQISKMKNLGRVLSGMEDVQGGQRPKKSGLQRRKKTDEERRKERYLKEAMRDLPLDESDLEAKWKTQLDTVKSRLKNQIRDLQDQIAKRERRKPDRQPIEYDQEAKALIAERDALKKTLDDLVGSPELSYEQKVKLAENAVERSIEKLEESIRLNNLAFKEKTSVTSEKLEALRDKQKQLKEELNEMRRESGIIEKQQLDRRKKAVQKRLETLQEKRKNKDYSKKERKPLPEDAELRELQRKYRKEKEQYDKEAYADELRNMHPAKKLWKQFVNLLGLQRVLLATGEFSFVFLQNAVPTVNMALTNPVKLAKIFAKTIKAYSNTKYEQDYAQMENSDLYDLAVQSRLALTRTNYKLAAKEEAFQSDVVTSAFKLLGQSLDWNGEKKLTLFDSITKAMGVSTADKKRFTIGEQVENANPFSAMERFTTTYGNHIKMDLFAKGVRRLEAEGKNPIDHKTDYKRLANAINTLTGRASLGRFDSISPELNALFFSIRFATSTFNKLNPLYYGVVLRDSENPTKPSVAQKIAISQMITYVATTTAFILAVQALGGEDDEGEKIVQIESNPTSSDFGKLKIGNIRFDPWGGHIPWVVIFARMSTGKMKKSNGKVVNLGEGSNDNRFDKLVDFGVGKANPTLATGIRFLRANEEIDGVKRDKYGNEVSIESELEAMYPIYWQGINEVMKENPEKVKELTYALTALGMLGVNNQVYGLGEKYQFKSYAKDVKSELSTNRNQFLRPNDEKVTDQKVIDANFESFKALHEKNYDELLDRIKKETDHMKFGDIVKMLKAGGHSEKDIDNLLQGKYPEMIKIKDNTIERKLELIESRLKKSEADKLDIMVKDVLKKAFYYNRKVDEYNFFLKVNGR